jgi:hypothetical protein
VEHELAVVYFPAEKVALSFESTQPQHGSYVMNLRSVTLSLLPYESVEEPSEPPSNDDEPSDGALEQIDIRGAWLGEGIRADVTMSQVMILKDERSLSSYDYEWDEKRTEFELRPSSSWNHQGRTIAVMNFINGEKPILKIEGHYLESSDSSTKKDKLIPIAVSLLRIRDAQVKLYPSYDVFDWGHSGTDKNKIANEIIATWKKYDEPVEAKFLNARNLVKAIDAYDGDWDQALIFEIACKIVGVDLDSYEHK